MLQLYFGHVDWDFEFHGVTGRVDHWLHQPYDDIGEELLHSTGGHGCKGRLQAE